MYRATIAPLQSVADPEARARSSHVRAAGVTHDVTRVDDELLKQAYVEQRWRKTERFGGSVTLDEYVSAKKRTFALMMEQVAHEYGYELQRRPDESRAVITSSSPPPSPVVVDAGDEVEAADVMTKAPVSDGKLPPADDGDDAEATTTTADAVSATSDDSEEAAEEQQTPSDSDDEDTASSEQTDEQPDDAEEQTDDAPEESADTVLQDTTPADSDAAESEED